MIRTWRSTLEEKWGVRLGAEHVVWPWLVEMVGWLMSRAEVGADGKTGYERSKGKVAKIPGIEFGEGVLWKRRREGGPLGKLTCMWDDGIYLGMKGGTGEIIVGGRKGVWRTRTVRRKTTEERWSRENLELIGGVPWKMTEEKAGDGEELKTEVTVMDKDYQERVRDGEEEAVPRKVYISREDVVACRYCGERRGSSTVMSAGRGWRLSSKGRIGWLM